jgi:hypothetical protein
MLDKLLADAIDAPVRTKDCFMFGDVVQDVVESEWCSFGLDDH